ncbi:MAG: DUF1015 domain-containing protein [Chitinophagales bacterium]|nr:DUF1015 domain-containing protein [Chitinophagaceae bacterium]MCB9064146.1 DUF1015 domain-containing protein [Chitinophagales bacterium]
MAKIAPFKGLRPVQEYAQEVATLPYDVVNVAEARAFKDEEHNFYHVTRSEIDLPENVDVHSQEVYDKAKENLERFIEEGVLIQDQEPCYYIYRLVMDGRAQTGLICGSSVDDYNTGVIKKHEFTRPVKENDRINHIKTTRAQTGVVFLAYREQENVRKTIEDWKDNHEADYNFMTEDNIGHTLWVVNDKETVDKITDLFDQYVPATYIADGHHRAASGAKVRAAMEAEGIADDRSNYFITCIFPDSELLIIDYNRVVTDLHGMSAGEFIEKLKGDFEVSEPLGKVAVKPAQLHEIGMYIDGNWYRLTAKPGTYNDEDPIGVLDVTVLQNNVLSKLLDINDPRTDSRVDFVGGIRGLGELEKRVDSGDMAAAFALYPVTIQQLFNIADSGNVMPPKSTWFEPKTRDGLVVKLI